MFAAPIQPLENDYVQLLDAQDQPSENHTRVSRLLGEPAPDMYLIEDQSGEVYVVSRLPEQDTALRRAWRQMITPKRSYDPR